MRSNYRSYDHVASASRMAEILDQPGVSYEERNSLPSRESLTFSNGYYANCSAIFIDIRGSSSLPNKYKRPKLARLYRAFLSEAIAVMNGDPKCREINVVGDGAWSVINTPQMTDIDRAFATVCMLNSMVMILNHQSSARGYDPIRVGIGASWGRALMVKAGLSGSAINDVVYMGDVVNEAAKLASFGSTSVLVDPIRVSEDFHGNLDERNQELLQLNWQRGCYSGDAINLRMDAWLEER